VARFLSAAWAEEFNAALQGVVVPGPGPDAGLGATGGRFTMVQEIHGTPDGDVRLTLRAHDGALHLDLELGDSGAVAGVPGEGAAGSDPVGTDVTIVLSYDDAAAMSRGELAPAEALNTGRIRVRGDLSVLVAAQEMLNAARAGTQQVGSATTY
jgi:putative sterol carrier protein